MRHRRKINHLSRKSAHRKAMLANMASSLILHKRIHTTVAKAKALRTYVEPLITKAKLSVTTKTSKEEATHLRRVVFSYLQNKEAVTELFREISTKVVDRDGGYTRIIKIGARLGDNAEMCMMELVDFNENLLTEKAASETKSRRRRRGGKKTGEETAAAATAVAEAPVEDVVEETAEAEVAEETVAAETAAEAVEEKVVEDVVEAPAEEAKTEEPVVEEVKEEAAPAAEVKEETEAKKEEPAEEKPEATEKDQEEEDKKE